MIDKTNLAPDNTNIPRRIIAIGGGKGGVGKSVISANLAVSLAQTGACVSLVDMDFGSANLHTCLGEKSPAVSIKDFLLKKKDSLDEILLDTEIEHLRFISGAGDMPGLANMKHSQKLKLIRHLEAMDADYIILDLAPGITFNVLDFFCAADTHIVITTPQPTSITNTFSYIKAALFRRFSQGFKVNAEVKALIELAKDPRNEKGIHTVFGLEEEINKINTDEAVKFRSIRESFKPKFILNMVRTKDEIAMGNILMSLAEKHLGIMCECLGSVNYDACVMESVLKMKPFVLGYHQSVPAASLRDIAFRIAGVTPEYEIPASMEECAMPDKGSFDTEEEAAETKGPGERWQIHVSSARPKAGVRRQMTEE